MRKWIASAFIANEIRGLITVGVIISTHHKFAQQEAVMFDTFNTLLFLAVSGAVWFAIAGVSGAIWANAAHARINRRLRYA